MMAQLVHRIIPTNGIRLHVVDAGPEDGPPVILLHGFPEFWYGWRKQIDPLAEAGFRVLAPDQRGYNLSDRPSGLSAYHMGELVADLCGLLDALGLERASVVGHDWGAMVAWLCALWHPERVEKLAILNVPHPAAVLPTLLRKPEQLLRSLYFLFFQVPRLPEAILRNDDWELLVSTMCASSQPGAFLDEDIELYRRAWWREGAMTAMLNWYRAYARVPPALPPDPGIRIPALILWGVRDFALVKELATASLAFCDRGQLVFFDDATHWLQHEEAGEVNRLLIDFLKSGHDENEFHRETRI
jgi:pimeloyl-ACP methyl ester carboxylesterase